MSRREGVRVPDLPFTPGPNDEAVRVALATLPREKRLELLDDISREGLEALLRALRRPVAERAPDLLPVIDALEARQELIGHLAADELRALWGAVQRGHVQTAADDLPSSLADRIRDRTARSKARLARRQAWTAVVEQVGSVALRRLAPLALAVLV